MDHITWLIKIHLHVTMSRLGHQKEIHNKIEPNSQENYESSPHGSMVDLTNTPDCAMTKNLSLIRSFSKYPYEQNIPEKSNSIQNRQLQASSTKGTDELIHDTSGSSVAVPNMELVVPKIEFDESNTNKPISAGHQEIQEIPLEPKIEAADDFFLQNACDVSLEASMYRAVPVSDHVDSEQQKSKRQVKDEIKERILNRMKRKQAEQKHFKKFLNKQNVEKSAKICEEIEKEQKRQKGRIDRAKRLKERQSKKIEYEKLPNETKELGPAENTLGELCF